MYKMLRIYSYKLIPTKEQCSKLTQTVETCRLLYNTALGSKKSAYKLDNRNVTCFEQINTLPILRKSDEYLQKVSSQVLQNVIRRVDKSYSSFFGRVKKKANKVGFPRFKGKNQYNSFTFPAYGTVVKLIDETHIRLFNIGLVKFYKNRPLEGKVKTVTIIRKVDGWYAYIVCEVDIKPLPKTGEVIGIDVGLENYATLSNGETIPNPRLLRKAEKKLKFSQRRLSRRKIGSNRRKKAQALLAKSHLRVKRARLDFIHKTSKTLIERFDEISVEKLNINNMMKNHNLAKSISDASWGLFVQVLSEKAESAARILKEVDPAYTSQDCSQCGSRVKKKLSERTHTCTQCGLVLHRDHNAAINIKNKGFGQNLQGDFYSSGFLRTENQTSNIEIYQEFECHV